MLMFLSVTLVFGVINISLTYRATARPNLHYDADVTVEDLYSVFCSSSL